MALTAAEEARLKNAEETLQELSHLIKGAGSKNQLNRLLVLAQEMINRLDTKVTTLETEVEELLTLARRLQ